MNKRLLIAGLTFVACVALILTGFFATVIYNGPRMQQQVKIEDFSAIMPHMAIGPVQADRETYAAKDPAAMETPSAKDPAYNVGRGKIYYRYYCLFCHGEKGRGDGPVGFSYVPVPADLTSGRLSRLPPEELTQRMVQGTGHAPVLSRIVADEYRPLIALYLKTLNKENK